MIFVLAALLGLVIAIARGVPLSTIADVRFRGLGVLAIAVCLHILLNPIVMPAAFSVRLVEPVSPSLGTGGLQLGGLLNLASFGFALGFLYLNRRLPGFALILVGLTLNVAVIAANGGQMPGDPSQLAGAGLLQDQLESAARGIWSPYSVVGPDTPLSLLADRIIIVLPFREPTVASIGDLVIAVGVVAFFNPLPHRRATSPQV